MKIIKFVILILALSSMAFAQWTQTTLNFKTYSFYKSGSTYYACRESGPSSGGLYKTTNDGTNWSGDGPGSLPTYSFAEKSSTSRVCSQLDGIHYTDVNYLWHLSNVTWETKSVITDGTDYYAGTSQGVYKSTNNGQNWTSLGLSASNVKCLLKNGSYIYAGTTTGLYMSTNSGTNWTQPTGPGSYNISALAYGNGIVWAGVNDPNDNPLWRSTNNGANWIITLSYNVASLATNAAELFVGLVSGPNYGVRHVYDLGGGSYTARTRNAGFPTPAPTINALVVTNSYLLAGTDNAVWRSPLSYVTEIKSNTTPVRYELKQNFPNPFNPSTTIEFNVPKTEHISLKVYDILGKEIVSLVDKEMSVGSYKIEWKANVPSGVYFYTLKGKTEITKKLVVSK